MRDKNCSIVLHGEQVGLTRGKAETRVSLRRGEKGAKTLVQEHGNRLVCVRHRYDVEARVRCETWHRWWNQSPGVPLSASPCRTERPADRPRW